MRALLVLPMLALGVGGVSAYAGSDPVRMVDNAFEPGVMRSEVGLAVTWVNRGRAPHEVTAVDGSFASGNIAPGASFSYTPTKAGRFEYYCRYHGTATSGMVGTLSVTAGSPLPKTGGGREVATGVAVLLLTTVVGGALVVTRDGTPA